MKLDQKQMHISAQLFMAAGKAGHPFDLARFSRDSNYAMETLAALSLAADASRDTALNALILATMDALAPAFAPASSDLSSDSQFAQSRSILSSTFGANSSFAPSSSFKEVADSRLETSGATETQAKLSSERYVGRLR